MKPTYPTVLFDFDGTLADTGTGVMKSAKYALDALGIPAPPWEELRFFVGPPLLDSFQMIPGVNEETAARLVEKYRERYRETGVFESALYPGTADLLAALKQAGVRVGVASSKPTVFITQLLDYFHCASFIDFVSGVSLDREGKSKKALMLDALAALNRAPAQAVMVGDRCFDMAGARQAGMTALGVLYGYGTREELEESGADLLAEDVTELTRLLFTESGS